MSYIPPTAPNINGLCQFIDNSDICMAVQNELASIRSSFTPDAFNATVTTFWIVAKYNSTCAGTAIPAPTGGVSPGNFPVINGDTAEHCLSMYDNPNMGV